jgi:hypothetical protein
MPYKTTLTDLAVGAAAIALLTIYLYFIHRREEFVARWDTVGSVKDLPALRSMYIWLFIVPIAARVLDKVKSPLVMPGTEGTLTINLDLPFSWQVFFFAALSASVANLIFFYACPELVRRFPTFSAFEQEGRDNAFLLRYSESTGLALAPNEVRTLNIHDDYGRTQFQALFWRIFDHDNRKRPLLRALCLAFQGLALWGVAIVLWQNVAYVYERIDFAKLLGVA